MNRAGSSYGSPTGRRRCRPSVFSLVLHFTFVSQFLFMVFPTVAAARHQMVQTETQAMMYLADYGYLSPQVRNPTSGHLMSDKMMSKAIIEFQAFANLNLTGYLDDDTLHTMSMPRCGVRDRVGVSSMVARRRSKRYALQGSRWKVRDLTYRISKYPRGLSRGEVDGEVARAFSVWSEVTPLTFTRSSGQVHIDIRFEVGEHGDSDPFDGPGGVLAHAFFPIYGGDAHFDDAEKWTVRSSRGTNLFQVAAHEFGHSLGLSHSNKRSALMAPFYRGYNEQFSLDDDDIEAIQALYGSSDDDDNTGAGSGKPTSTMIPPPRPPAATTTTTTTKPPPKPPKPAGDSILCGDGSIDTIFNSAEGDTYVFKGPHYWKLSADNVEPGYPKLISHTWLGLPNNIDAAFTYRNGKTYFFKGSKYWKYDGKKMDGDYPKSINEGFTGIPDNVQGATVWNGNGKIYFFKGSKFWRFDPAVKPPVKATYPKPIGNWQGIPDNIDDVVQYTNGYTYFFKAGQYWRFNDRTFSVDSADPPFPRNAGFWWFGCRPQESRQFLTESDRNNPKRSANYEELLPYFSYGQNFQLGNFNSK